MKTYLNYIPLFVAVSLPVTLALEFVGVNLPAGLDVASAFCASVIALVSLTVLEDYSRPRRALRVPATIEAEKAAHPLAA
jgi:hypothetical protein